MIEIGDILVTAFEVSRVIDVQPDYVVTLLQENIDGPVDQDEDNIGEFVLLTDIYEEE